jgi:hypothetical protein
VEAKPGKPLLLTVDIPTDERYSNYEVSLLDPAGKELWAMTINAQQARDTLFIQTPVKESKTGTYTLVIEGRVPGANPITVERQQFQLYSHY